MSRIQPGSGIVPSVRSLPPRQELAESDKNPVRADSDPRRAGSGAVAKASAPDPAPQSDPAAARTTGQLVLGPLASHPAGQLLEQFHRDLEAGNVAGIASRFTRNARHGSLRGQAEIADFYAEAFRDSRARRAELRVLRMERDGSEWRIEADLEVEVLGAGRSTLVQSGRSTLRLENRGDSLAISRLEP